MIEQTISIGPLAVRQGAFQPNRLRHKYDICIGVASWESRATKAFEVLPSIPTRWEVWVFDSGDSVRAEAKRLCIRRLEELRHEKIVIFKLAASLHYDQNFQIIREHLRESRKEAGRPLDILIDISCMPKKYILYLMAMSFRNEYVKSIDFIYSSGSYKQSSDYGNNAPMSWSSGEGDWASVQLPYLEASNFIPDARGLIVSLGAEISASVPFIERYEPIQIAIFSIEDEPTRINISAIKVDRRLLSELEALPITQSSSAKLEDAVSVATKSREFCLQRLAMSVTGLAIGSKPHALGLGIAALAVSNLEIVCHLPSMYAPGDVEATGEVFLYSVEDRFEPR
jgi:hypothetical protein